MKTTCNIGLSSMHLWIYLNGDIKNTVRGYSDADCNVSIDVEQITENGKYIGEKSSSNWSPDSYIEYSEKHVIKIRDGWDGFTDEKFYGKIKITSSNSSICNP